jgi:hypothetical protein
MELSQILYEYNGQNSIEDEDRGVEGTLGVLSSGLMVFFESFFIIETLYCESTKKINFKEYCRYVKLFDNSFAKRGRSYRL